MLTTATAATARTKPRQQRGGQRLAHKSAVTWFAEEVELLRQLQERYGISKDAALLRQLVIAHAREAGIDTTAAEARLRTPLQVRREAA